MHEPTKGAAPQKRFHFIKGNFKYLLW